MNLNQLSQPVNTADNLFQIFNLPKAGTSSYLFSDIIKVITDETNLNSNSANLNSTQQLNPNLIDSSKLIALLFDNIGQGSNSNSQTDSAGSQKFFITENQLSDFLNKLGLGNIAEMSANKNEIDIELTPEFLKKLTANLNSFRKYESKSLFASLDYTEAGTNDEIKNEEKAGSENGKIKIVFKKVESDGTGIPGTFSLFPTLNQVINAGLNESATGKMFTQDGTEITIDPAAGKTGKGNTPQAGKTPLTVQDNLPELIETAEEAANKQQSGSNDFKELFVDSSNPETGAIQEVSSQEKTGTSKTDNSPIPVLKENEAAINPSTNAADILKTAVEGGSNKNVDDTKQIINSEIPSAKTAAKIDANAENIKSEDDIKFNNNVSGQIKDLNSLLPDNKTKEPQIPQEALNLSDAKSKAADFNKLNIKPVADQEQAFKPSAVVNETEDTETLQKVIKPADAENSAQSEAPEKAKINQNVPETKVYSNDTDRVLNFLGGKQYFRKYTSDIFNTPKDIMTPGSLPEKNVYQISIQKPQPETAKIAAIQKPESEIIKQASGVITAAAEAINSQNTNNTEAEKNQPSQDKGQIQPQVQEKPSGTVNGNSGQGKNESSSGSTPDNNLAQDGQASGGSPEQKQMKQHTGEQPQHNIFNVDNVQQARHDTPVKELTPVYKTIPASDLVNEIKNVLIKGDKTNLTLKLSPEHLGEVKLIIEIKDSTVSTKIEVQNESVRQVVQNNVDNLKTALNQNGMQLSSFTVSLTSQEQKSPDKTFNRKKSQQGSTDIKADQEIDNSAKKMGYNTYEYLA